MTTSTSIEIRRRLPAVVSEVFDWWTDPRLVARWMAPVGDVEAVINAREGGSFRIVMSGLGMTIEHVGKFLTFDRPHRLVFTWTSPYTGARPSLVTVELTPAGQDSTDLRLVHSELPEGTAAPHGGGWDAMLVRLAGQLLAGSGHKE